VAGIIAPLTVLAAGLGILLLSGFPDGPPQDAPHTLGYAGLVIGVSLGLAFAWLRTIAWPKLPERFSSWLKVQRRRLAWALLGTITVAILITF
jgi:hypothetical protein